MPESTTLPVPLLESPAQPLPIKRDGYVASVIQVMPKAHMQRMTVTDKSNDVITVF